jgi:hypothetical protein
VCYYLQEGLLQAIDNVRHNLDVVKLTINGEVFIHRKGLLDRLRDVEQIGYMFKGERLDPLNQVVKVKTEGIFDKRMSSVNTATFGIYMTIFILFLLVVRCLHGILLA